MRSAPRSSGRAAVRAPAGEPGRQAPLPVKRTDPLERSAVSIQVEEIGAVLLRDPEAAVLEDDQSLGVNPIRIRREPASARTHGNLARSGRPRLGEPGEPLARLVS